MAEQHVTCCKNLHVLTHAEQVGGCTISGQNHQLCIAVRVFQGWLKVAVPEQDCQAMGRGQ